jgi:predicted phage gp36 major capsid-like protein
MSRLPVEIDRDYGKESQCDQLLALRELRRSVECGAPANPTARRPSMVTTRNELRRELEELIAALERRVPHIERAGEEAIARDAEALRQEALRRIATLDEELRASKEGQTPATPVRTAD